MGHQKLSTRHTKNHAPEFLILSALKLPSWELAVLTDMNIYIQKAGGRNFKILLKEVYPITWDSYHIFTKTVLNTELNIMLMLMEFACIRHS